MPKVLSASCTGVLALLLCACTLGACAAPTGESETEPAIEQVEPIVSDEEVVREGVEQDLRPLVKHKGKRWRTYVKAVKEAFAETLEGYDVKFNEFVGHAMKHVGYEILDVAVDGDVAKVTLEVSTLDVPGVIERASAALLEDDKRDEVGALYDEGSIEEMAEAINDVIYACMDDAASARTFEYTLVVEKNDNVWTLNQESLAELAQRMFAVE